MEIAREAAKPSSESPSLTLDEVKAKLAQLKSLLKEGLISPSDYEEQKKHWLGRL
jgi:hypothetical protein